MRNIGSLMMAIQFICLCALAVTGCGPNQAPYVVTQTNTITEYVPYPVPTPSDPVTSPDPTPPSSPSDVASVCTPVSVHLDNTATNAGTSNYTWIASFEVSANVDAFALRALNLISSEDVLEMSVQVSNGRSGETVFGAATGPGRSFKIQPSNRLDFGLGNAGDDFHVYVYVNANTLDRKAVSFQLDSTEVSVSNGAVTTWPSKTPSFYVGFGDLPALASAAVIASRTATVSTDTVIAEQKVFNFGKYEAEITELMYAVPADGLKSARNLRLTDGTNTITLPANQDGNYFSALGNMTISTDFILPKVAPNGGSVTLRLLADTTACVQSQTLVVQNTAVFAQPTGDTSRRSWATATYQGNGSYADLQATLVPADSGNNKTLTQLALPATIAPVNTDTVAMRLELTNTGSATINLRTVRLNLASNDAMLNGDAFIQAGGQLFTSAYVQADKHFELEAPVNIAAGSKVVIEVHIMPFNAGANETMQMRLEAIYSGDGLLLLPTPMTAPSILFQ